MPTVFCHCPLCLYDHIIELNSSEWTFVSVCGLCETSRETCVRVNSEKSNLFMLPHQIVGFNPYLNITSGGLYDRVMQGCAPPRCQVAQLTVFWMVGPDVCESSLWYLLHCTLLVPKILRWLLDSCKSYAPMQQWRFLLLARLIFFSPT
jgi:hypothetical protein